MPLGNLSSFGWESISAICPVGALSVMLADRALVPRAVVSLVIAVALILLFGRAFCGWICTVPLVLVGTAVTFSGAFETSPPCQTSALFAFAEIPYTVRPSGLVTVS